MFVPAQPKEMMPAFWSLCDVALIHLKNAPTFATVIPSKIFEAMGMGLPILLAAPKGEASEIVERENVGLWVPSNDPPALANAILLLKNDRSLRSHLAAQSRAMASIHSRERQAREVLTVLREAAGEPSLIGIAAVANSVPDHWSDLDGIDLRSSRPRRRSDLSCDSEILR